MTAISTTPEVDRTPIASWRHTGIFVAGVLVLAGAGAWAQLAARAHAGAVVHSPNVIPLYLSVLVAEWGLFAFLRRGLRHRGAPISSLLGRPTGQALIKDAMLAVVLWAAWALIMSAWSRLSGGEDSQIVHAFHNRGPVEAALWVLLSLSAGFCEELAFRGYLQRQLLSLTGSPLAAIGIQAVLFGVAHAYQGVDAVLRIAAFGVLFGAVAAWRGNPRAGMAAHALIDLAAGFF